MFRHKIMIFSKKLKIKSIREAKDLKGKTVIVRCDLNVPVKDKRVADNYKIIKSLPTVRFLLSKKAKIILVSHFGRPKTGAKSKIENKKYSLKPVAEHLSKLLDKKIIFVDDFTNKDNLKKLILKEGQIAMLENIRFYKGEEKNDEKFAKKLASLAQIYVNDAMAVSHRNHASVSAIKKYLPSYAGILLQDELEHLRKVLHPSRPFVIIMGGAKIATKTVMIKSLKKKAKAILIGGMITYDFLAAKNLSTGKYKVADKNKKIAKKILNRKIILPLDFVYSDKSDGLGKAKVCAFDSLPKNNFQFDIGPETIKLYAKYIRNAKTIVWNGPMGMFESEHFKHGTLAIARLVASKSRGKAFGLVGGGETTEALKMTGDVDYVDWVSTGGGAMLAYLAGEKMPGLKGITQ